MGMLALVGTRNVDWLDARESGGLACPVAGAQYVRVVAMLSGG
jgi:hypothetical protein